MKKIFVLSMTIFITTNSYGMQAATPTPTWQQWFSSWVPWAQYHWQNVKNIYNTQGFEEVCKTYPVPALILTAGIGCALYKGYNYISLENRLMRAIADGDQFKTASVLTELESNVRNARRQSNFEQIKTDAIQTCDAAFRKNNENKNKATHSEIAAAIADAQTRIADIYAETPRPGPITLVTDNDEDE